MKKLIAMLLCVVLVLSLATVSFAAEVADIRIEAEKPADKKLDLEFHPYSWDPNSGVDHTNRSGKLDADGLEYVYSDKSAINFVAHDSYTYTVDVPAAGTYELHILADSDRDTPITCTINGAEVTIDKFLGHTNGAGYAGSPEDAVLGNVELVKGTNTLTFAINENKNHNMYTDAYVLVPVDVEEEPAEPEVLPEILKGIPEVDGKLDDMYKESYSFTINNKDFPKLWDVDDTDNLEATVYFLHDGEWLYVCAVVTGDTSIVDTNKSWPLDGVDVWFLQPNESNFRTKITLEAHGSPSSEFNPGRENEIFGEGKGLDMTKVVNAATQDQASNSYVTEAKMPIPWASESEGTIVINVQLNNSFDAENPSAKGSSYGEQFGGDRTTVLLSDTEAKVPETPVDPDPENPKDGDAISVFVALMAISAVGAAVVLKKKEF